MFGILQNSAGSCLVAECHTNIKKYIIQLKLRKIRQYYFIVHIFPSVLTMLDGLPGIDRFDTVFWKYPIPQEIGFS
jgi:hypothetical protein